MSSVSLVGLTLLVLLVSVWVAHIFPLCCAVVPQPSPGVRARNRVQDSQALEQDAPADTSHLC